MQPFFHRAFIDYFPISPHIADQRRAIIKNNLLSEPMLQQIWGEFLLENKVEYSDSLVDAIESINNCVPTSTKINDKQYNPSFS